VTNASSVRKYREFLLWADALCINQGDNEERSQQVRNMRQIYSRAAEVFCWVGATSDPLALDELFRNMNLYIPGSLSPVGQYNREIVRDFFSQQYWRRVWIIQEIVVSSNVTFLWGHWGGLRDTVYNPQKPLVELSWSLAAKFVKLLMQETEGHASERRELGRLPLHLLEIRDRFMDKREPIHLLDAIEWTIETLSTDPRDKIFALLGLCHDGPTFVPVPNYQQPLETILADMSKMMMRINRSLDLICLRGMRTPGRALPEISTLPSWVPNYPNIWSNGMTIHETRFND
jgi:hypothetical protein